MRPIALLGAVALLFVFCITHAQNLLKTVELPPLLKLDSQAPVQSESDWQLRRQELWQHLTQEIYGPPLPLSDMKLIVQDQQPIERLGGVLTEQTFEFPSIKGSPKWKLQKIEPAGKVATTTLMIVDHCHLTISAPSPTDLGSCAIVTKNYEAGIRKGLAQGVAFIFVPITDVFPDSAKDYTASLQTWLQDGDVNPPGALIAWASLVRMAHQFEKTMHPEQNFWIMGFSRFGKVAALSMALDPTFNGGIFHFSGSLGATASRGNDRETLALIAQFFPHWIRASLRQDPNPNRLTTDQHALIAMSAPRPILVDDGDWDPWSNPDLATHTVDAASTIWQQIYGMDPARHWSSQDPIPDFKTDEQVVHKNFQQIHSLMEGNWDFLLRFIAAKTKPVMEGQKARQSPFVGN